MGRLEVDFLFIVFFPAKAGIQVTDRVVIPLKNGIQVDDGAGCPLERA